MTVLPARLSFAMEKLKSLHLGDIGVVEVIACGLTAIPALRELLFQREPSGLFQTRCRAVEALSQLKVYDVLIEFLGMEHDATDPVERAGDDAVINAAALAVAKCQEERVFRLLLQLARRSDLTGVIGALGSFGRTEAIPRLIDALEDDGSRLTAENALRRMGEPALPALTAASKLRTPASECESESSIRRRRCALKLIAELGIAPDFAPSDL